MSSDQNQALQKNPTSGLQSFLQARQKNLATYVAGRIKPDTLIRLALYEFSQNEWLRKCTPESIYASLISAAQLGLEPGGIRGQCYLVPYKGTCTLIPGWRGLVLLALRSKAVKSVFSHIVYEQDEFTIELGSDPRVVHRPFLHGDRGNVIGAYAVAILASGATDVEWMSVEELQTIREHANASRGGKDSPAYRDHAEEMGRKAPLRRLAKRLPLGDDFYAAAAADEAVEAGKDVPRFIDVQGSLVEAGPEASDEQPQSNGVRSRVAQARQEAEAQ